MGNPVMFVVEVGSVITTCFDSATGRRAIQFNLQITLWLWFTVLFANFAEAMAEGRGKAQAETYEKHARKPLQSGSSPTERSKRFRAPNCGQAISSR